MGDRGQEEERGSEEQNRRKQKLLTRRINLPGAQKTTNSSTDFTSTNVTLATSSYFTIEFQYVWSRTDSQRA